MSLTISRTLADSQLDPVDARALLRHVLCTDDASLITRAGEPLPAAQSDLFSALVRRRRAGEPVAYITGIREFFSLAFQVTPAVLIPRPETELLVEFALECIVPEHAGRVLDLGTGSGCIAISIARQRPRAHVVAVDASAAALEVARDNAQRLLGALPKTPFALMGEGSAWLPSPSGRGTEGEGRLVGRDVDSAHSETPSPLMGEGWDGRDIYAKRNSSTPTLALPHRGGGNVWFVESDWFSALSGMKFDLIVANPPYVAAGDPHLIQGDVRFEPPAALIAGIDGLDAIRPIIAASPQYLTPGGWLAFEHGYDQSACCRELLAQAGFARVFSRTDLAGIERLSGGQWEAKP